MIPTARILKMSFIATLSAWTALLVAREIRFAQWESDAAIITHGRFVIQRAEFSGLESIEEESLERQRKFVRQSPMSVVLLQLN